MKKDLTYMIFSKGDIDDFLCLVLDTVSRCDNMLVVHCAFQIFKLSIHTNKHKHKEAKIS